MEKSKERRRWESAVNLCHRCRWRAENGVPGECPVHEERFREVLLAENRATVERERAAPLPRPAPLPPRTPTRFE